MTTKWFVGGGSIEDISGEVVSGSALISPYETPFTILRTQIWVNFGARELITDIGTVNCLQQPQLWSFREQGSDINPDPPGDGGTWHGDGEHYLATGVVSMVPHITQEVLSQTVDESTATPGTVTGLNTYTTRSIVLSTGNEFVDSAAQRKCSSGFIYLTFNAGAGGVAPPPYEGGRASVNWQYRVLLDLP